MIHPGGTRFCLFPQSPAVFAVPETVWVSPQAGSIGPGPSDSRMYVVMPASSKLPYEPPETLPPFEGPTLPPALPDRDGHFDHIGPGNLQFLAAHLYGCARFTLDVWERHLGHEIRWWHEAFLPKLELVPVVQWNNAHSGPGYIETGTRANRAGEINSFCLNFDVVAHEIGHALVFAELGIPRVGRLTPQYVAFHETIADMVALLAAMEFGSVVEHFLDQTSGNLYALGLLGRLAEMSDNEQVRMIDFDARVRDFDGFTLGADRAWHDRAGRRRTQHELSQPLTAAFCAILIEIYQDELARRGVLSPDDDLRGWSRQEVGNEFARLHARIGELCSRRRREFRASLAHARDWLGRSLGLMLRRLSAADMTFAGVAREFLAVARARGEHTNLIAFRNHFLVRDIDPDFVASASATLSEGADLQFLGDGELPDAKHLDLRAVVQRAAGVQLLLTHDFRTAPSW